MGDDQPMLDLLEKKSEAVQRTRGTEPDELVRLKPRFGKEMLLEALAHAAVDSVGAGNHVAIGKL